MMHKLWGLMVLAGLFACNKDDCGDFRSGYATLNSIEARFVDEDYPPFESVEEAVPFNVGIIKLFNNSTITYTYHPQSRNWSLLSSAYACSPVEIPLESEGLLSVYANQPVYSGGLEFPSDSNLISLFENRWISNLDSIQALQNVNSMQLLAAPDSAIDAYLYIKYEETTGRIFKTVPFKFLILPKP